MRWLIWYIRSCFCKHEFKYEEIHTIETYHGHPSREGTRVSATYKKCGWHRSYWKV